jgi:hypothetical protein
MFRLLGWLLKSLVFAVVVLVAAHYIRWEGRTISDQISTHLARAERSETARKVREFTGSLAEDAKKGSRQGVKPRREPEQSDIPASERQKLRELIQELNR